MRVFSGAAVLWVLTAGIAAADCAPDSVTIRGDFGQARFSVEVADTNEARARGLMFRENLPASAGMLFVYPAPQRASFWMRNTLIPLDMLFADESGRIARVHANAVPGDETPIPGGDGVLAVLEINAGLARAMGIVEGAEMRHPAFPQAIAAWPCDGE